MNDRLVSITSSPTREERNNTDKAEDLNLLTQLTHNLSSIEGIHKLRKFNSQRKTPRSTKVTLDSVEAVISVLRKSPNLKNSCLFKHIFITSDKISLQMDYIKVWKQS